ncbi:MAG: DNA polymerase III subunit alpha [Rectinemataceae bacterium]
MPEFVHLHNHTDYSLLDGAAPIKPLVQQAKAMGMPGLAITDHGNMFGVMSFEKECRDAGINPIIGCEFYVAGASRFEKTGTESGNKYWHFLLLAENQEGYRNLMRLTSRSFTEGFYYKPRIDDDLLAQHARGLIASTACLAGEIPSLILAGKIEQARKKILFYNELFGKDHFYLELQDHGLDEQRIVNRELVHLSRELGIPLIATNDLHYIRREDAVAQDILLCIGTNRRRNDPGRMRFPNDEFYLKSPEEMAALFAEVPEALSNTLKINEMAQFQIEFPGPLLPDYQIPEGFSSPEEYLRHIARTGLEKRFGNPSAEARERLEYELDIIVKMGFTGYFLIVWDFINWAKEHGIPVGPGRGSGAGSLVAYSIRITDIDPLKYDLLFERFLNPERISMPDFDVDFDFERRGEVIDYVAGKYGQDRVGQIITFGTLKAKAVIKDVARALDIPFEEANQIAKLVPEDPKITLSKALESEPKLAQLAQNPKYHELFSIAAKLENLHRHSSLHAAGIVIGKSELTDYVPLYKDPKTGLVATQYTMEYLEKCGLVKMDFLGLKTLTLIRHTLDLIRKRGIELDEGSIPEDDQKTFALLGEGRSTSIFQFESQGMQSILKRAKPARIEDLIALNALYRPGPMDFIDQFIDSKNGRMPITYPHPSLEKYLKGTYGVIVYQEQVMQVAREVAGYSLGRADLLRRAMGKKKPEILEKERGPFIEGAVARGYSKEDAERIFDILTPFAGYGFNKSHAAAYSVVAYRTAYLKANYPAEFMAANLTNEIANTDKLTEYIGEARAMGLAVLPPDINRSEAKFTVDQGQIIYGLLGIKGVGEGVAYAIQKEREARGPYAGFIQFLERLGDAGMNRKTLESLILAGCFDSLGHKRRELMQNLERAMEHVAGKRAYEASRLGSLFELEDMAPYPEFMFEPAEEFSNQELLQSEKELLGFFFSAHPMDEYRLIWERSSTLDLAHLERAVSEREYVVVAMLKEFRTHITKNGRKMAFGVLEDYNGSIEMVVFSDTLERFEQAFRKDSIICVRGQFDRSRDKPSLKISEVLNPEELRHRSWRELHVKLSPSARGHDDSHLIALRDAVFSMHGQCKVLFHVPLSTGGEAVVEAGHHTRCSATDEDVRMLESLPAVEEVWRS